MAVEREIYNWYTLAMFSKKNDTERFLDIKSWSYSNS